MLRQPIRRAGVLAAALIALLLVPSQIGAMLGPGDGEAADSTVIHNSGNASYRVAIDVPPGTGGAAPDLALVYSSQKRNGPFGVGWSLRLSEIRCASRFGVPKWGPNYLPSHLFLPRLLPRCKDLELDGQLLQHDNQNFGTFHTFVESFREVRYDASNETWTVRNPDGSTATYGLSVRTGPLPSDPVARWLLTRVQDSFGNAIDYSYDTEDEGNPLPDAITYALGFRRVELVYENRPDASVDYRGGVRSEHSRRVREIQVISTVGGVDQTVYRLVLDYDVSGYTTGRSRLASVQRFGSDCPLSIVYPSAGSGCSAFPPETFEYTDANDVLSGAGSNWTLEPYSKWGEVHEPITLVGDVNGDGVMDAVWANCSHGWPCGGGLIAGSNIRVRLGTPDGGISDQPSQTAYADSLRQLAFDAPAITVKYMDIYGDFEPSHAWANPGGICEVTPTTMRSGVYTWGPANYSLIHDGIYAMHSEKAAIGLPPTHPSLGPPWDQTFHAPVHWQLVDLNADGLADLVGSARIAGVQTEYDCAGNPNPQSFPGVSGSFVFMNTGSGWVEAPDLAEGMPPFSIFSYLANMYEYDDVFPDDHICAALGLSQFEADYFDSGSMYAGPCVAAFSLAPRFVDLNGDRLPDLIVAEPEDPDGVLIYSGAAPYHNPGDPDGVGTLPPENPASSVSYVQSRGGGWVRAPEFDLPFEHVAIGFGPFDRGGPWTADLGVRFVDLNQDSLVDVLWTDPLLADGIPHPGGPTDQKGVLLNTGSGWCSSDNLGPCSDALARYMPPVEFANRWCGHALGSPHKSICNVFPHTDLVPSLPAPIAIGDVNGDGLPDIVKSHASTHRPSGSAAAWLFDPAAIPVWQPDNRFAVDMVTVSRNIDESIVLSDLNGDGAVDLFSVGSQRPNVPGWAVVVGTEIHSDLLKRIDNSRGKVLDITYVSAVTQRETSPEDLESEVQTNGSPAPSDAVPLWGGRSVVQSVTVTTKNQAPTKTEYRYGRPRYCPEHRSHLGFGLTRTDRADGSVADTFFYQEHGRAGKPFEFTVSDGGEVLFRRSESWELNPVDGTGAVPTGTIPGVHLGRLVSRTTKTLYSGAEGSVSHQDVEYDDNYGYNFVSRDTTTRPTGTLRIERIPVTPADTTNWILGLVDREDVYDHAIGGVLQSRVSFDYEAHGRIETRSRLKAPRDNSSGPTIATTYYYDSYGNLIEEIDELGRSTEYCYDGDSAVAWCPWSGGGPGTHSVQVGRRDPAAEPGAAEVVASSIPDPLSGEPAVVDPGYADVPGTQFEFGPFLRPIKAWTQPTDGSAALLVRSIAYRDHASDPHRMVTEYIDGTAGGDQVRSWIVDDGMGGVWKTVREVPTDQPGALGFVATATQRDGSAGTVRLALPVQCSASPGGPEEAPCAEIDGATGPATVRHLDGLGRIAQTSNPDGGVTERTFASAQIPSSAPAPLVGGATVDEILTEDPEGGRVLELMDGDRLVAVDECDEEPDPPTPGGCSSPDRTYYTYDAPGDISTIYDPSGNFGDPKHYLRYAYDTLGRRIRSDDPDAGTSTMTYDDAGNLDVVTDARGFQRDYDYDGLNRITEVRITDVSTPGVEVEPKARVTYRPGAFQRASSGTTEYTRHYGYDELGRVRVDHLFLWTGSGHVMAALAKNYTYDLLGRPIEIHHPITSPNEGVSVARYEYEGSYLRRVCDLNSLGGTGDCSDPGARAYLANVEYDELGRRKRMVWPGGERTFAYNANYQLLQDKFEKDDQSYHVTRDYPEYDKRSNVRRVVHSSTPADMDVTLAYTYDHRNRIKSWSHDSGAPETFEYDSLGNLTKHGDEVQKYLHPTKPHAITRRDTSGVDYAYDESGNIKSILGGTSPQHFTFNSDNRITCIGAAAGACDVTIVYDIDGERIMEKTGSENRFYSGQDFHLINRGWGIPLESRIEIYAFGERIAQKFIEGGGQRVPATSIVGIAWRPEFWGFAAFPLLVALSVLAARYGALVVLVRRPGYATLAGILILELAVPGVAWAGGGIPAAQSYFRWVLSDQIGSGMLVVDDAGDRVRQTRFTPFGQLDDEKGGMASPRYFGGHPQQEDGTGIYPMRARWYDPGAGRFLSVDPVLDMTTPQTMNAYSYVANNPINAIDPDGRLTFFMTSMLDPATGDLWLSFESSGVGGLGSAGGGGGGAGPGAGDVPGGGGGNLGGSLSGVVSGGGLPGPGLSGGGPPASNVPQGVQHADASDYIDAAKDAAKQVTDAVVPDLDAAKKIAAEELAKRPSDHNNLGDAMRHAEASRRVVDEVNTPSALIMGYGHEAQNLLEGSPIGEVIMDLHNNAAGRAAGAAGRPVDPGKLITDPARAGGQYRRK